MPAQASATNSATEPATLSTGKHCFQSNHNLGIRGVVATFNLVSWALNSFGVPLDDFLPGAGP
jgi:4-carboxymuconolactone decarboxylase